ncbi:MULTISPECIES: TonB-dependent receptor domain-containing protein [Tenacibaculum]|uniref:TonB-dependent receptor domain-containing protein n=1 Tax=Tenacibaculum TaxID=104267 RepID=UPI001F0B08C3|nr:MULTISPECIES: outer membrane beta-barrel family protein [Tenacibaculum]MCH3882572.1 TonB-dependent receptor [Tenacibaculum aquimarinum]MDO6599942.1 TonB-dependent receptor [Tenacibaculum sp. 1_MG-2023]
MKKITLFIACLFSLTMLAQKPKSSTASISGKVIETVTKQPLEYATIVLTNLKTKRVSGGITDMQGNFSITVPQGNYAVKAEFIGFKTKKLGTQDLTSNKNIGTISLSEDAETLDEVEIIAEKSTVEIRLDKKIYNVGKDMTVKGGSASDVLDNVPSVNVDTEGAVSLRGNENVRILIDGKPSALAGLNGTDALRNLPADAIEKVEVITSPSARYDAEGTAGILNIILRKGKVTGFNGSVNVTVGNPDMLRISPSLNYRTKKINLFTNLGYSYRKGPGNSQSYFTNYENDVITDYRDENRTFDRKNKNYNGSLGLEYYLNKNSSITGMFVYKNSNGDDLATNVTTEFDANKVITDSNTRIENEIEKDNSYQYSINYTNNISDSGEKLTIDLQYQDSEEDELADIYTDDIITSNTTQVTKQEEKLIQIDYILPVGKESQFEFGHKSTLENTTSNFVVEPDNSNQSNELDFTQNIYAFYGQYGSKIDKLSYLLGLRAEITDIDINLLTNNETSEKNYTEWFPTFNLGYELSDNDNLTLGYSRRLRRPRSRHLSPFESQSSATNIYKGNPDLDPTFTNSYDLGYTTRIRKFNLGASIYYQHSTDIMQFVSTIEERNGTNVFIRQPVNLTDQNRYGMEFTANFNPSKTVKLSGSFNYFKFNTDAFNYTYTAADGTQISTNLNEVDNSSWFARFNATVNLPAEIQWQTRVMYRGPQADAQGEREGMLSANLAFSKDIFNEKASLVLNVSDLFNSRKRISNSYNENLENNTATFTDQTFQWRVRQISLSFTYRFNQKKKKERPQGGGGDQDGGGDEFNG